jgi:hypothetical protein
MPESVQDTAHAALAPFALVEECSLREAVDAFGHDVLGAWGARGRVKVWTTPTGSKSYAGGRR